MRVLLYEWCCSGGLAGGDASIAREGRMILQALAFDAAKAPDIEVAVLVDDALAIALPSAARAIRVSPGQEVDALVAAAGTAEWTIIVAPESDGILLDRVRCVRAAGVRVLAPHDAVIETTSDKQKTIDRLAAVGVAVPAGRALAAHEPIPRGFSLPAIRKARWGCGCEELRVCASHAEPPAPTATRLEAFVSGTPIGVSCLCGPQAIVPLPAMQQLFSPGSSPYYLGSDVIADVSLAARATALAVRAVQATGADAGWVGVDLILGRRPDGLDDRVLEINPRLTTSIVGQTKLFASSLVAAMIAAAEGRPPHLARASSHDRSAGSFSLTEN